MSVEAIIFDWAGTTVDYGCFAPVQAFIDTFAEKNIFVATEEVREPMGMLKRDHISTLLNMPRIQQLFQDEYHRSHTEEDIDEMLDLFTQKLMKVLEEGTELKPYVLETVEEIKARGIKVGTTTGYTAQMLEPVAKRAAELGYSPDAMFTPDDTCLGRPYPYMIFENLKALDITSVKNVIKVGDTVSDIQEAKNAGVRAFGVIEGSSVLGLTESEYNQLSEEEKRNEVVKAAEIFWQAGADEVLLNLKDLLDYI